jgi:hypothetical protein
MSKHRPIRQLLVFASLVTFALALCAVGARTGPTGPQTVIVTITPGNPPTVSPDPAVISKSAGDEVFWECPNCTSGFQVQFPKGSPFSSASFSQSNPHSGKANGNAAPGLYPYVVTASGHTADPGVQLTP